MCRFGALAMLGGKPHMFPELCKGCGGCLGVCPLKAIKEVDRPVGVVEAGAAGAVEFAQGRINVGETSTPRVIRAVRALRSSARWTLIDAPPGASCAMTAAVRGADFAVLVMEPTPFGLHDLELAADSVRRLSIPFGIVVNRYVPEDLRARDYCARENVPLLAEIPDDRPAAEAYSRGENIVDVLPEMRARFASLWTTLADVLDGKAEKTTETHGIYETRA